jgi:hypothetical protein
MTIETLKQLINFAFDSVGPTPQVRDSVNKYLDLYEKELDVKQPQTFGHRKLLVEQPPYKPNLMDPYCGEVTGSPYFSLPSTTSDTVTAKKDLNFQYTSK